jgi:hypothetical protein
VYAEVRSTERRRRLPPSSPEGYVYELPALIMLDRLPIPILASGLDGVVVYTNLAFASMLGHPSTITLTGQRLPALLAGRSATPPHDCVTALRAAPTMVVDWLHAEGFPVHSVISNTVFVRATDQILLISATDITELTWNTTPTALRCAMTRPQGWVEFFRRARLLTASRALFAVDRTKRLSDPTPTANFSAGATPVPRPGRPNHLKILAGEREDRINRKAPRTTALSVSLPER